MPRQLKGVKAKPSLRYRMKGAFRRSSQPLFDEESILLDEVETLEKSYRQLFITLFGFQIQKSPGTWLIHAAVFARYLDSKILSWTKKPFIIELLRGIGEKSTLSVVRSALVNLLVLTSKALLDLPRASIEEIIGKLAEAGIMSNTYAEDNRAHSIIFTVIGWVTMLYEPVCDTQGKGLGLRQANDEIHTLHDDLQELGRPLVETLSKLGLSLPSRGSLNNENVIPAQRRELNSSTLNAATLKTTAETRICWVQTLDEHLILDEVKRELKIFCFPSFCLLCQMASPETVIQRFLNEYEPSEFYDEQHPVASFFKEILESYKLLFAENEASRHHYRRTERRYLRKALGDKFDPYLDELCGLSKEGKSTSNQPRIHYTDEFPILGSRLEGLQEFIDRQPPRSGKTLWKDKRNMKDWWTFWAVIIFGSIGTIIGILQVVLAVLQIVWAIKSYNLTLEQ